MFLSYNEIDSAEIPCQCKVTSSVINRSKEKKVRRDYLSRGCCIRNYGLAEKT